MRWLLAETELMGMIHVYGSMHMKSMFVKNQFALLVLALLSACQPASPVPPLSKPSAQPSVQPTSSPAPTPPPQATASPSQLPQTSATPLPASSPTPVAASPTPVPTATPAPESFRPKDLEISGHIAQSSDVAAKSCDRQIWLETAAGRTLYSTNWYLDGSFRLQADLYSVTWQDMPLQLRAVYKAGQTQQVSQAIPLQFTASTSQVLINDKVQETHELPAPTPVPGLADLAIVIPKPVNGWIYDTTGAPVSEASVTIKSLNSSVPFETSVTSDASGQYVFRNTPPGVQLEISVAFCGKVLQTRTFLSTLCDVTNRLDFGVSAEQLKQATQGPYGSTQAALQREQIPICASPSPHSSGSPAR